MHCEHEHDDGAYVLGALSPAERLAFERHLDTCSFCREAVADISTLPDMLGRLDAKEFAQLLDPTLTTGHPGSSLRDLASPTRHNRRKSFRVRLVSSAAAAVLVALIGVGMFLWTKGEAAPAAPPPGPAVAMAPVGGSSPITATVRLTSATGGTKVEMVCSFAASASRPNTFRLIAYGPDEDQEQIGSWQAAPGAEFPMNASTHFGSGSLARLEIVRYDGKALLAYDVP